MENVSRSLGASPGNTFIRVTFPLAWRSVLVGLIMCSARAIMNNGAIVQTGEIRDIFQRPSDSFVAYFVGMKNILPAVFNGRAAKVGALAIEIPYAHHNSSGYIAVRPEDIVVSRGPLESSMRNSFAGMVSGIIDQGFLYEVHIRVSDVVFKSLVTKGAALELGLDIGTAVQLSFKSSAVHIF